MKIQDLRALPIVMTATTVAERIVALWNGFATRRNPIGVIIVVWAVLALPLVFLRGFHSDEGVAVTIARSALEDGYWVTPHMYNTRFVERPTLLSWMIAAVSAPFGSVSEFTARLPIVLFLLTGCWLIYALMRRVGSSIPGALLGAALFLACPIVIRAYAIATADLPLAVLLFASFVVWWDGYSAGRISLARWMAIGGFLALAGLLKGPQPVSYFALGIGLFIFITRSWRQIPGFILAGVICVVPLAAWYVYVYSPGDEGQWATFMRFSPAASLAGPLEAVLRLISETLPAALLAMAFFIAKAIYGSESLPTGFVKALLCYGVTAAVIVSFWPGGSTARYFFPLILPLCVFGGLGYDALVKREPMAAASGLVVTFALLAYSFIYSDIAAPLLPKQFRSARIDAARISEQVAAAPAPVYLTGSVGLNVFPLVPGRIIGTNMATLKTISGPAWIAVEPAEADTLLAARPKVVHLVMPFGQDEEWRLLRLEK
jgi:4-amino-4-deoxy-L-arabinose transferase-like glycosyltransferase